MDKFSIVQKNERGPSQRKSHSPDGKTQHPSFCWPPRRAPKALAAASRPHLLLAGAALALTGTASGAAPAEQMEFFEKKVRPLLVDKCYSCHSPEHKVKGGLRLDTREAG